ncbi:MAG: VCBS repeat-containing protein [Planctomycetota bacterium]
MQTSHFTLAAALTLAAATSAQDVLRIWRGEAGDGFGVAMAALEDVDLDGRVEIAVGAPDRFGGLGAVDILSTHGGLVRTLRGETSGEHFGQVMVPAGDLDRDGNVDLWVLSDTALRAFNCATGTKLWQYPRTTMFAALGDYDGDGHDDVAFATAASDLVVRSGRDGGLLLRMPVPGTIVVLAGCGDVDGDGHPELMTTSVEGGSQRNVDVWNLTAQASVFHLADNDPGFGEQIGRAGDVDGDGHVDFFVYEAQYVDPPIFSDNGITRIYSGITFAPLQYDSGSIYCYHMTCWRILRQQGYVAPPSDVNGDGRLERIGRYELWDTEQTRVRLGGEDLLRLPSHALLPVGDVDTDGFGEYAMARPGEVWLVSAGRMTRQRYEAPYYPDTFWGCYPLGDVDGDGHADFYYAAAYPNAPNSPYATVSICSGSDCTQLWSFRRQPLVAPLQMNLAAGGDIDHDGHADIAVTGYGVPEIALFGSMHSNTPMFVFGTSATRAVALGADWNADGVDDVFCADTAVIEVRSGNGGGLLDTLPFPAQVLTIVGDVDGDGVADLLADNRLFGSRKGLLHEFPRLPVAFVADSNGDGLADVWTVDGDRLKLLSGFDFTVMRDLPAPDGGDIVALAGDLDWNGDGWLDLAVGQPAWQGFGRVAVVSGLEGCLLHTEWGEGAGDEFGVTVGMLGQSADTWAGPVLVARSLSGGVVGGYGRWVRATTTPAAVHVHGIACGIGEVRPHLLWQGGAPRLGGTFALEAVGMNPGSLAIAMLAMRDDSFGNIMLPVNLRPVGMPGCVLRVGPELQVPAVADSTGRITLPLQVPDVAALLGLRVFAQTLALEPRANQLGLLASDAARIILGR